MAQYNNPGMMFIGGSLIPSERSFIKKVLEGAKKSGYTKFVEPCSGAFEMSHLAVQAGFKPSEIETSDVSLFSSVFGYAIMGKSLEDLQIRAEGFTEEEMLDPATVLYALLYLRTVKNAGKDYFYNILVDLKESKERHIKHIQEQIDRAKGILNGFNYRPMDMWTHMDEVADDSGAFIVSNPPTYTGGFEKFYDTAGMVTWNEPHYDFFDAKTGRADMYDRYGDCNATMLVYEEAEPGKYIGPPVFARYGMRNGVNVYLTTNKPNEVTELANGKTIARPNESKLEPLKCTILPFDYEITKDTQVFLQRIERPNAQYYRKIWTHGFTGSVAAFNFGMFIDGQIAGVVGMDTSALTIGAGGKYVSDSIFIMYGMTIPHRKYRISRLLTMLVQNKDFIMSICSDIEREKVKHVKTVQQTKYPESKDMRGLMKLTEKYKNPRFGYKLTYQSEIFERTVQETLEEWLKKEERWRTERAKAKAEK